MSSRRPQGDGPAPIPAVRPEIGSEVARPLRDRDVLLYLAWLQALIATTGSLFLSEVLQYPPCTLCWYQRIAMYPLVIVLAVGILRRDPQIHLTVIPISVIGLAIAIYHNLLYIGFIEETPTVCRAGISCTTRFFEWFGFITIPFLSMTAFAVITIAVALYWRLRPR